MHGLRSEYQNRVNFVILDFDQDDELSLARSMKVGRHPAYAVVPPNSPPGDAAQQIFGPQPEEQLRALLTDMVERFPVESGG